MMLSMRNNIHDKVFICPICRNRSLYRVEGPADASGIGYHDLCVCDECGSELLSEPQFDDTVRFVDAHEEEED